MRVFVATDLRESSTVAVREAHRLAFPDGVLAVCHVVSRGEAISERLSKKDPRNPFGGLGRSEKILLELRGSIGKITGRGAGDLEVFVEEGSAHEEIVRRARTWKSDIIVVGAGRTGLLKSLLGSEAEGITRHAHCPVLVARPRDPEACVLVATDLSDPSLPAVGAGAREALRLGVPLAVLHVTDLSTRDPLLGPPISQVGPPALPEIHRSLRVLLEEAMGRFSASGEALVEDGPPAATILQVSRTLSAGLVVVGSRGRTGLARMLLGSVAEEVMRLATCSVLVVRINA